jgi:hypothetical protein
MSKMIRLPEVINRVGAALASYCTYDPECLRYGKAQRQVCGHRYRNAGRREDRSRYSPEANVFDRKEAGHRA